MSIAFETTIDDLMTVLKRHGVFMECERADHIFDKHLLSKDDRLTYAALHYITLEDQTESVLDEIEDILIEDGIINGPKLFKAP
jgi:hypothetical protein